MLNNSYVNIVNNEISIYSFEITKELLNDIYNDIINKYINNKYINNIQYTNSKSVILKSTSKEDNFLTLELICRIHIDEIKYNNHSDNNDESYKKILISTPTFSGYNYIFED